MKRYLLTFIILLTSQSIILGDLPPITIHLHGDFFKTGDMVVDGTKVTGARHLAFLENLLLKRGSEAQVSVRMPITFRFIEWNEIRGLLDKVGFQRVEYLVVWPEQNKAIEVSQVGLARDIAP